MKLQKSAGGAAGSKNEVAAVGRLARRSLLERLDRIQGRWLSGDDKYELRDPTLNLWAADQTRGGGKAAFHLAATFGANVRHEIDPCFDRPLLRS
jgi:hypothetical protein